MTHLPPRDLPHDGKKLRSSVKTRCALPGLSRWRNSGASAKGGQHPAALTGGLVDMARGRKAFGDPSPPAMGQSLLSDTLAETALATRVH